MRFQRRVIATVLCACLAFASWPARAAQWRAQESALVAPRLVRLSLTQPLLGASLRAFDLGAFLKAPEAVLSGLVARTNAFPADSGAVAEAHAAALLDSAARELQPSDWRRLAQVIAELSINPASDAAIVESLYTRRGASPGSVEANLAKRLSLEPINGTTYGSEASFLRLFSKTARVLIASGERLSPETRLLARLERAMDRQSVYRQASPILQKNLAILSDDLYLAPDTARSPDDRLTLARIRARLSRLSVKAQSGSLGWRLVAPASEVHSSGVVRSLYWRARAYAQGLLFLVWWNWGPPVRHVWREYRRTLERERRAGRKPAARDARGLFTSLRLLGISGRLAGNTWVAADPVVLAEARALFSRHFEAGPQARAAFDRFLDRAVLYNPGKRRTKLRSMIAYYMREGSTLPASRLADYYDAQAHEDEALKVSHERQERVLADFKRLAAELVLEANHGVDDGHRLLGILVFGSYANGAPRPGSDLDFQVITEDGSAPAYDIVEALRRRWAELPHGVRLEPISFLYVPADKELLGRLHPEPFIIASPYARVTAALSPQPRRPQEPLAARVTLVGRLLRGLVGLWLRGLFWTVDLYDRLRGDAR